MSDSFSYSFDFNLNSKPKPDSKPESALALDYCSVAPLSQGMLLLRSKRTGKTGLVQGDVFGLLTNATRFRPMSEHVEQIVKQNPQLAGRAGELRQTLESLKSTGLMVEAKTVLDRINQPVAATAQTEEPADIYVATTDRPEALKRLLDSFGRNVAPGPRFRILDDSRDSANRKANQALIAEAAKSAGHPLEYIGHDQDKALADRLKAELPEHADAVDFLLNANAPPGVITPGRSWNKALLRSAGRRLIRVDDDVICQSCPPRQPEEGVELSSRSREIQFLQSDDEWQDFANDSASDPLADHSRFLGLPLADALRQIEPGGATESAIRHLRTDEALALQSTSPILVTACGSLGDPGMSSNDWLYDLQGESRLAFAADQAGYQARKTDKNLWLGRRQATLSTRFALISQITGIDNRALLPPYFPWFRNEDFLFGNLIQWLHPGAMMMELPWSVPHLPIPRRRWEKDGVGEPAGLGFQQFIAEFVTRRRSSLAETEALRWRELVLVMQTLADASDSQLTQWIEEQRYDMQADLIRSREMSIKTYADAPEHWTKDMRQSVQINLQSLVKPRKKLLADMPESVDQGGELGLIRHQLAGFAASLAAWPILRIAAVELRRY